MQKKLEAAQKSLAQAKKAKEAHAEDIAHLEKELAEVEKRREEFQSSFQASRKSKAHSIHLEEDQVYSIVTLDV